MGVSRRAVPAEMLAMTSERSVPVLLLIVFSASLTTRATRCSELFSSGTTMPIRCCGLLCNS